MSTATDTANPIPQPADQNAPPKTPPPPADPPAPDGGFDPDSFRMTVGEHLEELRWRLILAIGGFFVTTIACLLFSERVIIFFCQPLTTQLLKHHLSPQVYYSDLMDPFMTYIKITLISAGAIAGPWIIYQIWKFVASGLYPHERKMITKYIPLSVTLFISGLVFVYVLVLPLSIKFFIEFSSAMSPTIIGTLSEQIDGVAVPYKVPIIPGDIKNPPLGSMWFDSVQQKLKVAITTSEDKPGTIHIRAIPFAPESMMAPIITLGDYISMVITFMLTFGIAFQLPLVILALVTVGIVDVDFLRKKRKLVWFLLTIASAFLAPGDIVASMLSLLIPMVILYEFGIWLAIIGAKKKVEREEAQQ